MLFLKDRRNDSAQHQRVHALFEIAYTFVDFAAAGLFVLGSIMFLFESWQRAGTWLFIVGLLFFAMKPTLQLARELRLAAMGKLTELAERPK